MNHRRPKPGLIVILAGALFPLLLVFGAQKGTGQEKAVRAATAEPAREWTTASHDKTNFPLIGKHRTLTCRECHINNVFEGTPTDCEVCHWQRRQDDRYGLRLGTRCSDCHSPMSWKKVDPAKWSHETEAGFRLEGVHRTLDCEACHGSGGFAPRPTECLSCHLSDYQAARDPNHAEANFPTDCRTCHNQRGWAGASFSGHGGFELRGRHATAACSACHKNGVYAGTPTDCAACHLNDYNGTTDPDHRAAGFPLDCTECHGNSANGWTGASFIHDFPIQSGKHAGFACSECHRTSDFRSFSCLECHEQTATNNRHSGVTGYAYSSPACYTCHPRGAR